MLRRLALLLVLALSAYPLKAQAGPGLFGDRRWRAPVANAGALPASGSLGEMRLTLDDGALHFWDGDSWEDIAGAGGSGEANTASNLGGGIGLYSVKVGADLRFNSLAAADFDLTGNVVSIDDAKWAKDSELPTGDAPHSRTVTVDAGGLGDYATISEALAYVATQERTYSMQWLILVYPGAAMPATGYEDWFNYEETGALAIPSFTTLQGVSAGHNTPVESTGAPILKLTKSSGTIITLDQGSSLVNFQIVYVGDPSAPVSIIDTVAPAISVTENVAVWLIALAPASFPAVAIANSSGGLYLYNTSVAMGGPVHEDSRAINNSSAIGLSLYGGRFYGASPCSSLIETTAGVLKLFWSRVDSGDCSTDLTASGSGSFQVTGTPYGTVSGPVTHMDGTQGTQFCKTYSGTGSPEGAVSAPVCSSYWRRDGGAFTALYLKQSGNDNTGWVAVGSSAQALAANGSNCSTGNVAAGVDAAGNGECVADDDVPEAGDFGALALTGPVTSSGLATTIAADAVALGSQTSGAYVAGATSSQGLTLTGSEAGTLGLMDCAADEILKRNSGDTAWTCAADGGSSGGAGDVVGPGSATDNALARFDGTTGKLLQNSAATLDDSGVLVLPDGSASAAGFRFSSMAAGTGLYAVSSSTLGYTFGGAVRWNFSNVAISGQNGAQFRSSAVGSGEPVFIPGNGDLDTGLAANADNDIGMLAGNGYVEKWQRVTSGVWRATTVGQAVDTPQAVTCTDSGNGSPGALTVNPTGAAVYVTNSDADGCAVTLGETNVASGQRVEFVVVSTAGGSVSFSDSSGVTELAGAFAAGLYDSLALRYISDRWIETGRSDN